MPQRFTGILIFVALAASIPGHAASDQPVKPIEAPPEIPLRPPATGRGPLLGVDAVYFPPTAPVFRAAIESAKPSEARAAPFELAPHVGDYFYPALGSRLHDDSLGGQRRARLANYLNRRDTLAKELLDRLLLSRDAEPAAREFELRAFAAVQAPRLAALENEAEQLRIDLIGGPLFTFSVDWRRSRRWILGATQFPGEPVEKEAEYQITRAAAFYQAGLLPAQRGLLRELAHELDEQARAARGAPRVKPGEATVIFFSPETTRLHVPANLTPALTARLARYNGEKAALKRELAAVVRDTDRLAASARTAAFSALADTQWPRLLELEDLAEEIRRGLAALPPPRPPVAPPRIPAELLERIETYNADRRAYINDISEVLNIAASTVPQPDFKAAITPQTRSIVYRDYQAERLAAQRRALESFQSQTESRFQELVTRLTAIREELSAIAQSLIDPKTGKPLNVAALMARYRASIEAFDALGREETIYVNYRAAMLQPGLSPEQRRLLFSIALAGLAQPLPPAEGMPRDPLPQPVP